MCIRDSLCIFASRLPLGLCIDGVGSRSTVSGSCLLGAVGCVCFSWRWYEFGFGLLAFSGPGVHIGAMHASNLFPVAMRRTVLGTFSTAHQVSTFWFAAWLPLFVAGASLKQLFSGYALLLRAFGAARERARKGLLTRAIARAARERARKGLLTRAIARASRDLK